MKIVAEDKQIEARSLDYVAEWERGKPVGGDLRPSDALQKIQMFETRYVRLKEERDNVAKANLIPLQVTMARIIVVVMLMLHHHESIISRCSNSRRAGIHPES